MPPSKQVVDRQKDAVAVCASVETHSALVAGGLEAAVKPHLRSGEKMPDFGLTLTLLGRLIQAASDQMVTTDTAHQTELSDDDGPRAARDAAATTLVTAVVQAREALDGVFGTEAVVTWGLKGTTPRDPAGIVAFAEDLAQMLATRALPTPRFVATLDRTAMAADLRAKITPVQAAMSIVALEAREAEGTLVERDNAKNAFDKAFGRTSTTLTALYRQAGQDELASRIRPSRHRPGRLAEPSEPTETPPEAPTPPAEAPPED